MASSPNLSSTASCSHTAGPWNYEARDPDIGGYTIQPPNKDVLCVAIAPVNRREPDEALANARLIAAAPDMLNALKAALALVRQSATQEARANSRGIKGCNAKERLALIEAALSRAEGK